MKSNLILASCMLTGLCLGGQALAQDKDFPNIPQPKVEMHGHWGRMVTYEMSREKPMLMIGGELGNSSASTLEDIHRNFAHLNQLGLNTVLAPITWELIEPTEGVYDFSTLDILVAEARANRMKLVLLWFGAWKNSMSCYAPEWVKRDVKRFPRVHDRDGKPMESVSPLSTNVLEADKRALCACLQHLKDIDWVAQTVVMIQVENEIGMVGEPRDYSADATKLYNSAVPKQLTDYLAKNKKQLNNDRLKNAAKSGTWAEMFGNDAYAEEIFQAWTYAQYVEQVAKAGKEVYNLPMYVNVALNSRGRMPGEYPSGGPLAHLIDIWHCAAPSLSVLGLDLYDKGYRDWTSKYHLNNNPLFIPEIQLEEHDGVRALYAFGHHDAMGFSPFSIEDCPIYADANNQKLSPLAATYKLLRQTESLILKHQGTEQMDAVLLDSDTTEMTLQMPDGMTLTVSHSYTLGWEAGSKSQEWPEVGCVVIRQAVGDYLVIGSGVVVTFAKTDGKKQVGLAKVEQVEFDANGQMHTVRHLNGDQTHQGRHVRIPVGAYQIQRVRVYEY